MKRLFTALLLIYAFALPSFAADVGLFFREDCTAIGAPVTGKTVCFDQTAGTFKRWNGSSWAGTLLTSTSTASLSLAVGDNAGLSNNNTLYSLGTLGRYLNQTGGEGVLGVFAKTTTGSGGDKSAFYAEGWNAKGAGIAGNITAANINGVKSGASYTSGMTYAAYAYAHHAGDSPDGGLIALGADIGNYGTAEGPGADANYKMNIALGSMGTNLADFAIYTTSADQGWLTGYYQTKVSFSYLSMASPLGYPVGAAASTYGIVQYNSANWKSALSIPNNVWIHSAYSTGSIGSLALIKGNSDDATISLGNIKDLTATSVSIGGVGTPGKINKLTWNATASVTDGAMITHSLGTTPTAVIATPSVAGEIVSVTALAATTFTVAIKKHDGTAGTSQTIYWMALN